MPKLSDLPTNIKQLISGTAPGQTIKSKEQAAQTGDGAGPDWQGVIDLLNQYAGQAAASDAAGTALQAELGRGQLALGWEQLAASREQFDISQAFLEGQEAFRQEDIRNQRLLEAAGLATGPTGAIQLAYLARGQGAPQEEVASIFQNLPFIQELLHGQNVPGFGLPEQLGGESARVSSGGRGAPGSVGLGAGLPAGTQLVGGDVLAPAAGGAMNSVAFADLIAGVTGGGAKGAGGAAPSSAIQGRGLGVTIPGKKSIPRHAFEALSDFEQEFLGALGQSETGQSAQGFLEDIIKSFIPTRAAGAISIA